MWIAAAVCVIKAIDSVPLRVWGRVHSIAMPRPARKQVGIHVLQSLDGKALSGKTRGKVDLLRVQIRRQ